MKPERTEYGWKRADTDGNLVTRTNPGCADTDGDGLTDYEELHIYGTNPTAADTDCDGLADGVEVDYGLNPLDPSDIALDPDEDGLTIETELALGTDPFDPDTDGDGLDDGTESFTLYTNAVFAADGTVVSNVVARTDPLITDTDGDGLTDGEEVFIVYSNTVILADGTVSNYTAATSPIVADADGDGLTDFEETTVLYTNAVYDSAGVFASNLVTRTNPECADTDGDSLADYDEVHTYGTNPTAVDTDGDGIPDLVEILNGLDPLDESDASADPDGDGLTDGWEHAHGFDPLTHNSQTARTDDDADADPDGDGLTNREENDWGTNPLVPDTDGDGVPDGTEVVQGSDPADASDGGVPESRVPVEFCFGDHSGSHSEKYKLTVKPVEGSVETDPRPPFSRINLEYGECEWKTVMLKPGCKYEVTLEHAGSNRTPPDYDYTLDALFAEGSGILLDDPDGLAGEDDTSDYFAGEGKKIIITVLRAEMGADYGGDGKIDAVDVAMTRRGVPLRHWINDDSDRLNENFGSGDTDRPLGEGRGNLLSATVQGRCDLLDFTPVWFGLSDLGQAIPPQRRREFSVEVAADDDAVGLVWTSLSTNQAGDYLRSETLSCGPALSAPARRAYVIKPKNLGTRVPVSVLKLTTSDGGKGIALLEGCGPTISPLTLQVLHKNGHGGMDLVLEKRLDLRISSVKDMYRWKNLRISGKGRTTADGEPVNMPDSVTDGDEIVFLHGFHVNAGEAEAWGSEMFKRLHQSGFRGRFTMVTWDGDAGLVADGGLNYHANVTNAFLTAPLLKNYLDSRPAEGSRTVVAHSLGNMVVSSAIHDHGLRPDRYFMCNSAVPAEAYDASLHNELDTNPLVHDEWRGYRHESWASCWHELFDPAADDRGKLTWKGRFSSVASMPGVVNLYSTGDEVLELKANGTPWALSGGFERYAWHKQESFKGRIVSNDPVAWLSATGWCGWGFRSVMGTDPLTGKSFYIPVYSAAEANAMSPDDFRTDTVFNPSPTEMFSSNITFQTRNAILAKGIPALAPAAGRTIIFQGDPVKNKDLQKLQATEWGRNHPTYGIRWLHGDMKEMAYFYVYRLFYRLQGKEAPNEAKPD